MGDYENRYQKGQNNQGYVQRHERNNSGGNNNMNKGNWQNNKPFNKSGSNNGDGPSPGSGRDNRNNNNPGHKRKHYFDRDNDSIQDDFVENIYNDNYNPGYPGYRGDNEDQRFGHQKGGGGYGNRQNNFGNNNNYGNNKRPYLGNNNPNKRQKDNNEPNWPGLRKSALGITAPMPPAEPIQGRCILVQITPPHNEIYPTISSKMREFGDVRSDFNLLGSRGICFFNYEDIRSARSAWENMQDYKIDGYNVDVRYSLPKANAHELGPSAFRFQGTILAVLEAYRGETISHKDESVFRQYGDVRGIYTFEGRQNTRVVEYFNLRAAEAAYNGLHEFNLNGKGNLHVIYLWDGSLGGWPPLPPRNYNKGYNQNNYQGSFGFNGNNQMRNNQMNSPDFNNSNQYGYYDDRRYKKSRWNQEGAPENSYNNGYANGPYMQNPNIPEPYTGNNYSGGMHNQSPGQNFLDPGSFGMSTLSAISAISAIANSQPNSSESPTISNNGGPVGMQHPVIPQNVGTGPAANLQLISALIAQQQQKNKVESNEITPSYIQPQNSIPQLPNNMNQESIENQEDEPHTNNEENKPEEHLTTETLPDDNIGESKIAELPLPPATLNLPNTNRDNENLDSENIQESAMFVIDTKPSGELVNQYQDDAQVSTNTTNEDNVGEEKTEESNDADSGEILEDGEEIISTDTIMGGRAIVEPSKSGFGSNAPVQSNMQINQLLDILSKVQQQSKPSGL
ncbi:hypothetical protein BB558_000551 [Smittium angustum]|uniref:RRM domain-containing protein n=1 Tax=Smittium angustum TaxID=133377 RepID=A0A2U1JE16_SMIAN|nr:hypothetical protein BB558_000551 [Smittium angustum]